MEPPLVLQRQAGILPVPAGSCSASLCCPSGLLLDETRPQALLQKRFVGADGLAFSGAGGKSALSCRF